MKKSLFIISAAAVLLTGCAKEQLVEKKLQNGPVIVVSATFEDLVGDDATKAAVADAGTFTWQNGDKAAFAGESAYLEAQNSSTTATASFSYSGTLASSTFGIFPFDLTTGQSVNDGKVKVPTSRAWAENQTNVAMYATYASNNFNFEHLGGLVKVTINNIPTTANKFVFKTKGWKINGVFDIDTDTDGKKKISASSTTTDSEMEYTLTFTAPQSAGTTMTFYVPLPVGTYDKGFAVYLKNGDTVLSQFKGSTSQSVNRKSFLIMPAITLASASIEDVYKDALVETIPAGYSGYYLLPKTDKLVLKIKASNDDHDIILKYNGENIPTKLEIKVVDGDSENAGDFNAKLIGNLPYTHVDFRLGNIDHTELTTSASTFAVIHPATVGTLTVTGGNVVLQGATVNSIVVASGAVADSENNAVQIEMKKYNEQTPAVSDKIEANAKAVVAIEASAKDVVVAPAQDVTVKVEVAEDAENINIITSGEGTVTDTEDKEIKAGAAMIGDEMYPTLAAAIAAVQDNETITMQGDVNKASGISVPSGKNFTVDFQNHKYAIEEPGAGSNGTKTQGFQLLQGSTIVFKNGTIECTEANKEKNWSSGDASKGIALMIQNYANLTLEDMTIDATNIAHNGVAVRYALSNNSGNVEYKGATSIITVAGDYAFDVCKYDTYDAPTVTWNSTGDVTGIIELSGGNFVVAKDLKVTTPIRANSGASTMTISEGVVVSPVDAGFRDDVKTKYAETSKETQKGVVVVNRGGDLKITGQGTIDAKGKCYAAVTLTEKGEAETGEVAKLTVLGSSSTASKYIKLQGGQYYAICGNGGRGNTDVTVKYAQLDAPNGFCIYQPQQGNLTIESGTFNGYSCVGVKSGNITIKNGTFNASGAAKSYVANGSGIEETGQALIIDNCDYPGGSPVVNITGGTFTSAYNTAIGNYYGGSQTAAITKFIHGGTYSSPAEEAWVGDDIALECYNSTNSRYEYKTKVPTPSYSGTYKLLKNYSVSTWSVGSSVYKNMAITFDLGGHVLTCTNTSTSKGAVMTSSNGNTVTIKNGTISVAAGLVAIATQQKEGNTINLESSLTINTAVGGILVEGSNTVNCAATIINTGNGAAIQTNGSASANSIVNITGGTITSPDVAVYHPAGTLYISGGSISGTTGVYVKSGTTTISGGTITGNGEKKAYQFNGNGCYATGDALVVDNCGYPGGAPSVSITAGSFTSTKASAFGSYKNGDNSRITGFVASSIKGTVSEAVASNDDVYKNN